MTKKLLLLANPVAGKTSNDRSLLTVIDRLVTGGCEVTVETTQRPGHCVDIIKEKGDRFDIVTVCGGDGTLNEAVRALLALKEENRKVPELGYIPAGTVNDFAKSHDIPREPAAAAANIINGIPRECDIGILGENPFVYVAAFGSFTDTSYTTPQKLKNIFGRAAYILHGAAKLYKALRPYKIRVEYDGGVIEGDFVYGMASNSRTVGGFPLPVEAHVALDDGLFEVILFRCPNSAWSLWKLAMAITRRKSDNIEAYEFSTSSLKIIAEGEIPWTTDGEFGGNHKSVEIRNIHRALKIIVPKECQYFGDPRKV